LIQQTFERAIRTRFWLPVLVLLALFAMAVNEISYQHSHATLSRGITLTDARLQAANTLQILTDAEFSTRQYIMRGHPEDLLAFNGAMGALPAAQAGMFGLISKADPEGLTSLKEVQALIAARVNALQTWMTPPIASTSQLPSSESSRAEQRVLRAAFDQLLIRAAAAQGTARVSLYNTMLISRLLVHALVLLSVLALVLWARQLRGRDEAKEEARQFLAMQVDERTTELRHLAGHLENAREDERGHVARELHDDLGGLLTAMKLEMARLRRVPDLPAPALERMASLERRLNDGIALKRRIIENLRPSSLDQLGLGVALEMLCADVSGNLGIPVVTQLQTVPLNKDAELTVYRVVQESLTNISKYARASEVIVSLASEADQVRVSVKDDGKGFEVNRVGSGHHGLLGMRVRLEAHAGKLTVRSKPGEGTFVCAELPKSAFPPLSEAA
jgi:signal transduction histidine kinase